MTGDQYDTHGLLHPEYIDVSKGKKNIYERQYKEARTIEELFDKTPVQIVADDVGTGKTWVAMMVLFSRLNNKTTEKSDEISRVKRQHALVVAPTRMVASKWIRELHQFNRNFVQDPEKTTIDQLHSTEELLELFDSNKRKSVSQAYESMGSMIRVSQKKDSSSKQRSRRKEIPEALLLLILSACNENDWKQNEGLKKRVEAFYRQYHSSPHRRALQSMLPQRSFKRLIRNLRCYINYFKKADTLNGWCQCDFDMSVWAANKKRTICKKQTWLEAIKGLLNEDETSSDRQAFFLRMDHALQIISVLWNVDDPVKMAEMDRDRAVLKESTERSLLSAMRAGTEHAVLSTLSALLNHGLPERAKRLFKNFTDQLQDYGVSTDFDVPVSAKEAECIMRMLAAYAARLKELSGFDITVDHSFMRLFSAAAVFRSPMDLHNEIAEKRDCLERWKRLADFIEPIWKQIGSKRGKIKLTGKLQSRFTYEGNTEQKNFDRTLYNTLLQRLARAILQLVDYDVHPERVGSSFWDEKPKQRAIHVLYMNDLRVDAVEEDSKSNQGSPNIPAEKESLDSIQESLKALTKKKKLVVSIIDEAHNWRNEAYGAKSYKALIRPLVERTLLLTATPLHMGAKDLKTIIDLSKTDEQKKTSKFPEFENSYKALFEKQDEADDLLGTAVKHQKEVTKAWEALVDDNDAFQIIETQKAPLDSLHGSELKNQQIVAWRKLKESRNEAVRKLAETVLSMSEFQTAKLLHHLRLLIVKTRSQKHFNDYPAPNSTRRYLCGQETAKLTSKDLLCPPAVDTRALLHPSEGLRPENERNSASWIDLLGMRLSEMPVDATSVKNARLLVCLPSSYEVLWEGAIFKSIKNAKKENAMDKLPAFTKRYAVLFKECLAAGKHNHTKVSKTIDVVFQNLMRGEKTLVFCQWKATIRSISDALNDRLQTFIEPRLKDLPKFSATDADPVKFEKIVEKARKIAGTIEEWSDRAVLDPFFDRFLKFLQNTSQNKKLAAADFDARVVWLVSAVTEACDRKLTARLRSFDDEDDVNEPTTSEQAVQQYPASEVQTSTEGSRKKFSALAALTGQTKSRQTLLANFSSPFYPLILICSQVSQEGVEMHRYCRNIILHDLNWNPAVLEQRIGRLDRVGSYASEMRLPVDVYVPFRADSYDEYQYERVLQRAELQELIFGRNDKVISDKDWEELSQPDDTMPKEQSFPRLGNLIHGFFDMDLSTEAREALCVNTKPNNGNRS